MKKLIFPLVLMFGVIFLISRFTEVSDIVEVIQKASWYDLIAAVIFVVLWMLLSTMSYRYIYAELGMPKTFGQMFTLFLSAFFANTVTPTAGISSIAVFLGDAYRNGLSRAKVTVAWSLFLLMEYFGLLTVIGIGLIVLFRRGQLDWSEISATLILLALAGTLVSLLYLGMKSAERLEAALLRIARFINAVTRPFVRREYISAVGVHDFASEMAGGIQLVRQNPRALGMPAILALMNKLALVTVFMLTFNMFGVPFSIGTIVAGFAVCYLFTVVSPTPAGVGIVEGVLPLSLTALHVRLGAATIVTLAYRGLTFWLPLLAGMITFRLLYRGDKSTNV